MNSIFDRLSSAINVRLPFREPTPVRRLHLSVIRKQLVNALQDCDDRSSQRVAFEIQVANSAQDLWLLRTDVHCCISLAYSQEEASARIDPLAASFIGWLPPHQLATPRRPGGASASARAS